MNNKIVKTSEYEALGSIKIRAYNYIKRKKRWLLKFFGLHNFDFLVDNKFEVYFSEEEISLIVPRFREFERSVNLFDQREVLHRAIIFNALNGGIIDRKKSIIDAGAQNGDCALVWAKMIDGTVYSVDPSPRNLAFIRVVARLNNIKNIKTINCAIGEYEGYLYPIYSIDHTPFSKIPGSNFSKKNKVLSISLDILREREEMEPIGYIHLDVEGMELEALRGAMNLIAKHAPVITFEAHITIDDVDSIFLLFHNLNYSVFMINESTPGGRPDCINFLALPNSSEMDNQIRMLNAVKPIGVTYKTTLGDNLIKII